MQCLDTECLLSVEDAQWLVSMLQIWQTKETLTRAVCEELEIDVL